MNSLKKITSQIPFKVNKCSYCKNTRVLDTDKGKFVVKKNNHNNNELFRYLETKNFNNFVNLYNYSSDYEVYPYIDNVDINDEEKALDIVYLITLLHNKTTFYKTKDIDLFQSLYEDINNKLTYLYNYYDNLRMVIEEDNYMSPSSYLLLRNISIIFRSIDDSKFFIEKWYKISKDKDNYRVVTIHNNLELDHLIKSDSTYLISWNKSCRASPIYDFLSLYKNTYERVDSCILFDLYNSKYTLYEEEKYLLFSLLLVPSKIDLSNREIINTKEVYELTNYLISTINFISKYYSNESNTKTD